MGLLGPPLLKPWLGFSEGRCSPPGFYSSWFDHVKGWLSLLQDLNMLLITYEELHQVGPLVPSSYRTFWTGSPELGAARPGSLL